MYTEDNKDNQQNLIQNVNPYANNMYGPIQQPQKIIYTQNVQLINNNYYFKQQLSGFEKLMAVDGIYIRQKFRPLQCLTGCELQNRYYVYPLGADWKSKNGSKMLKCKETSGCIQRQLCSPHCRAFSMDTYNKDYFDNNKDIAPFLHFERPFKCTCFCLERPEMEVRCNENQQQVYIGKVKNPFKWFTLICEIYDQNNQLKYSIEGDCCQCGVIFEGPCCQNAELIIKQDGMPVGTLKRVMGSIVKNCFMTNACFAVTFPKNSSAYDRALFIAATIMIDFAYFERKTKN